MQTGEDEFVGSGTHLQLKFRPVHKDDVAVVRQVLEGTMKGGAVGNDPAVEWR